MLCCEDLRDHYPKQFYKQLESYGNFHFLGVVNCKIIYFDAPSLDRMANQPCR